MATNKIKLPSLATPLQGAENWLDPVQTLAELPATASDGDAIMVYADPTLPNNGIYIRRTGQWEFAPGGSGGGIQAYQRVVLGGSYDAVDAAINSLPSSGGTVFLQAGNHTLDVSAIRCDLSDVRILGEGPASRLIIVNPTDSTFVQFGVNSNIENLELVNVSIYVAPAANQNNIALAIGNPLNSAISVERFFMQGCHFSGGIQEAIYVNAQKVYILNCTATGTDTTRETTFIRLGPAAQHVFAAWNDVVGFSNFLVGDVAATDIQVVNNVWVSPTTNPVTPKFVKGLGANNVVVSTNGIQVVDVGTVADEVVAIVDGSAPGTVIVSDNKFDAPYGVSVDSPDAESYVSVRGNTFRNVLRAVAVRGDHTNTKGFQIVNNSVFALAGLLDLIALRCPYGEIAGNSVYTNGQTAVVLQSHYSMAANNRCLNLDVGSVAPSIAVKPETVGFTLQGNSIVGNIYNRDILDQGTNTLIANNLAV